MFIDGTEYPSVSARQTECRNDRAVTGTRTWLNSLFVEEVVDLAGRSPR